MTDEELIRQIALRTAVEVLREPDPRRRELLSAAGRTLVLAIRQRPLRTSEQLLDDDDES